MFNIDQIIKALQTDPNTQRTAMTGAAGPCRRHAASRRWPGQAGGNAAKLGAVAAVGGLAYSAWQNHQKNQQQAASVRRCTGAVAGRLHAAAADRRGQTKNWARPWCAP